MLKKHFIPYKKIILKAIAQSETADDLHVCSCMMNDLKERFQYIVEWPELAEAMNEISANILQQSQTMQS